MNKIVYALKDHFVRGFKWSFYLFLISYLTVALIINYSIDLENGIIDKYYGQNIRILYYFMLYGAAYYPVAIVYAIVYKNPVILRKGFWIKSLVAILLLSFDRSFHYHAAIIKEIAGIPYQFWTRSFYQLKSLFTIIIPVLLLFHFYKEKNSYYYGLTVKNFDWKPYAVMLGIMAPLIIIVSFEPNFYNYYPRFKTNGIPDFLPLGWAVFIYESTYGLDFLSVEIMFRGFLVLGMMKFLGKGAVFPMVALYCFYHFGKPWGEAASSIIGGYILGVISLYTRTIFGGVLIHIGIAWMMELVASIQKYWPADI